jgi:acyl-CoA reductase-like NAD-dependent aldehyde dehydrogenase
MEAKWRSTTFGNPLTSDVQVGTLLDSKQANYILEQIAGSGAEVLAGGTADGNLLAPTLAAEPSMASDLVAEGLFGAAMWVCKGDFNDFCRTWSSNRYPMCAGVLSNSISAQRIISRLPNIARLCLNGDPSIEHIYEPWGGYPSTGNNPVSDWRSKYRRMVQLDQPA